MPDPNSSTAPAADAALVKLNRLFVQALVQIGKCGDAGDIDTACRLAAQGWSALRHDWPREAERLNGVMHSLTGPRHTRPAPKAAEMTETEAASAIETSTERMQDHER